MQFFEKTLAWSRPITGVVYCMFYCLQHVFFRFMFYCMSHALFASLTWCCSSHSCGAVCFTHAVLFASLMWPHSCDVGCLTHVLLFASLICCRLPYSCGVYVCYIVLFDLRVVVCFTWCFCTRLCVSVSVHVCLCVLVGVCVCIHEVLFLSHGLFRLTLTCLSHLASTPATALLEALSNRDCMML
jgi:hypothetical protein